MSVIIGVFVANISPRYPVKIILFIGNGMGNGQVSADYYYNHHSPFPRFPATGMLSTHPDGDRWITDSAASATALATGVKVKPGTLAVDENGNKLPSVMEIAQSRHKGTGIVVTTSVTQPTPAAFTTHFAHWGRENEIAEQQQRAKLDVLMGGGLRFFQNNTGADSNLTELMSKAGYTFVATQTQLEILDTEKTDKLIGLFAIEALKQASMRSLSLAMMTEKAVNVLDNYRKGFFLMVEGSQIDWRCHEKDGDGLIDEMLDFDNAIRWALDYQMTHPELLIVVLGDHETGGLALVEDLNARGNIRIQFLSTEHSANICPVFAKGPGQDDFIGFHDIEDIGKILINLTGKRHNFLSRFVLHSRHE